MKIPVVKEILSANDQVAAENRAAFDAAGLFVVNLMASPGAGKTSLILRTVDELPDGIRPGVIEGDLASSIDADTIAAQGIPVVQINTGGNCHLDAPMIRSALPHLPLDELDLLFIENVGNLICPANFALGADLNVVIASVPEGHDKPYKYPGTFANADVVVLNKADLLEAFDFDVDYFHRGLEMVNPGVPFFVVSCRSGEGIQAWVTWLMERSLLTNSSENQKPRASHRWHFDPVDIAQMRLLARLNPGQRVRVMLEAQALARGLIWGRLRRQYPEASERELALKFLEEIDRVNRKQAGP
jgi:hydrogenase nickel incorporation protein HypB